MQKQGLFFSIFLLIINVSIAQVPANYYNSATGLTGTALKNELNNIITSGHSAISYNAVWSAFYDTDVYPYPNQNTIWDMYSDVPGGTASYYYSTGSDQCGSFTSEGDCYNREHSFPKSWWGGSKDKADDEGDPTKYSTQYTDLHQLVATDGYVNQQRNAWAFGEVNSTSWTSSNGSKRGSNTSLYGSSITVFEPIDEYKGDFARALFYMATRYDVASWRQTYTSTEIVQVFNYDGSFRSQYYDMMFQWHTDDPVSQKELDRNDEIYNKQHNANPYVNHPEWVCEVFGGCPSKPEPDNYPTSFVATANGSSQIDLSWTDATGTNLPDYYLIKASTTNSFTNPVDGTDPSEDTDLSDGSALVKVAHASGASYSFSGLNGSTTYYFKIWSYVNTGANINFKTSGTAPTSDATTDYAPASTCEDFTTGMPTSYYTGDVSLNSGTWHFENVYKESASASRGGTGAAARLNDDMVSSLRTPVLNTAGTITFWYRELNSGGGTFSLQKSYDNSSWTTITTQSYSGNTYTSFSYDVNDAASNIYIKILSDNPGHLIIDDFCWTAYASTASESDVVRSSSFTEPSSIAYANYQASDIQNSGNDIEVAKFTLRDGGASGNDSDALETILTDITFSLSQEVDVKRIALYDGSTELAEMAATSSVTFSGLSITASDDATKDFSLRVSFESSVSDHDQFQLSVTSVTASGAGSAFATSNGGGASSSITGDRNRLNVIADRLSITNPSSANLNTNFTVSLLAIDGNDNTDLDENSLVQLSLASGGGTLSSVDGLSQNLSNGAYSWTDVQYDIAEIITVEGQSSTLINITSSSIQILGNGGLFISEVVDPNDNYKGRYVELYNASSSSIDLSAGSYYLTKQSNGGSYADIALTGTISVNSTYTIAYNTSEFQTAYGFAPDQTSGSVSGNGDDAYFLYENGNHSSGTLLDIYGVENEDGTGKDWEYIDGHAVRKRNVMSPTTVWDKTEWVVLTDMHGTGADQDQMTPNQHKRNLTWTGNTSTDWNNTTNWDLSFVPDASDNVMIASATNKPTVTEDAMSYDLTIISTMQLTENANLHFEVAGTLLQESNASGTGSFLSDSSKFATIETYISQENWHMMSPPVIGDDSGTFTGVYLKEYNESDSSWTYINPTTTALPNGQSYFVWSDASMGNFTAQHQGTINVDNLTINLSYTNPHPHPGGMGWNMVGNPYSSALYFDNSWTFTNVGQTIYAWDSSSGNYKSVNSSGTGTLNPVLAIAQGFWVRSTAGSSTISIPKSNRQHSSNIFLKKEELADNEIHFTLTGNSYSDDIVLAFNEEASSMFDVNYDAYKLFGNPEAPQWYLKTAENSLSMNTLPFNKTDVFITEFIVPDDGVFTIEMQNNSNLSNVYLWDKKEDVIVNLTEEDYVFTANTNDLLDRFEISFTEAFGISEKEKNIQLFAFNNVLYIQSSQEIDAQLHIYDLLGKELVTEKIKGKKKEISLLGLEGVFLVRLDGEDFVFYRKVLN